MLIHGSIRMVEAVLQKPREIPGSTPDTLSRVGTRYYFTSITRYLSRKYLVMIAYHLISPTYSAAFIGGISIQDTHLGHAHLTYKFLIRR